MLERTKSYFAQRREGLTKAVGIIGGLYIARRYIRDRMEEVKEGMERERGARDNLKRRFVQTQEDVSYTILALLPTLSSQILDQMNIDSLTQELQSLSTRSKRRLVEARQEERQERPPSSLASSIDIVDHPPHISQSHRNHNRHQPLNPNPPPPPDQEPESQTSTTQSDFHTLSSSHHSGSSPQLSSSGLQNWVSSTSTSSSASRSSTSVSSESEERSEAMSMSLVMSEGDGEMIEASPVPSSSSISMSLEDGDAEREREREQENLVQNVLTTANSPSPNTGERESVDGMSESVLSSSIFSLAGGASASQATRTKAELWNELKMLTFTRTLTTLYSTTLLSLLTTLQLTILARSKYITSIYLLEREERMQEHFAAQMSMSSLLFRGIIGGMLGKGKGMGMDIEGLLGVLSGDAAGGAWEELEGGEEVDEDTESRYLTLSWWLLHVGWKDVGERVRRGVEEVFDGVSLKSNLSVLDIHRLIGDVRRRVEYEITFEGTERRINFLSTLLPPTPETIHHVLSQNGFYALPSSPSRSSLLLDPTTSTQESSQLSTAYPISPSPPSPSHAPHNPYSQPAPFLTLLAETQNTIASSDFSIVLEACLDRATEVLMDGLEKNVFAGGEERIRLASLLPGLARWSDLALNGLPNELVDNVVDAREVSCLSAIVFARFEEKFNNL